MDYPSFSIVVPTYNRPSQLQGCLEALAQIDYPRDRYQVVVVDDGSVQPLDTVVEPFQPALEINLLRQKNAGPAAARNAGAQAAKGDYIAFTDDDCMPAADWLAQFAIALGAHPDAMIGGHTINALPQNLYSSASQALIDYIYEYYGSSDADVFFASNNIAMSRSQFLEIGGFDISFPLAAAEDRELCDRWQQSGYPMQYAPSATIQHAHALSLKSFWRQHFGYGRGAFCFHKARAQRTEETIKVEPVNFYTDLLTYPMKNNPMEESGFSAPLQVSGLFFLSQVATATGFFWEKWTAQRQQNSVASS
ncbi:glycosyltransferase family 2 protein [cf. Phormidesmis sp. LEGE 11477]|uniref:glycosyltransferase n=1 Tax=cf. Phormidesmis sp. LEGE 11477 TaxID=1828680 RepID=UPI00187F827F|nr:glycosyltransferase [cf. Phormidesmis sp. LEGE 11477]MBE9059432.1 glycosyltransferase [cf. Phormidesmis sp. LEGE 11477]